MPKLATSYLRLGQIILILGVNFLFREISQGNLCGVHEDEHSSIRVPKLAVLYLPAYFLFLELYPFTPSKVAIFSRRAIAS